MRILSETLSPSDRIIIAVDTSDVREATHLVEMLGPYVGAFKFGLEFFHAMRRNLLHSSLEDAVTDLKAYRQLHQLTGNGEFTDAKLHDIPNTVEKASVAVAALGPRMFNVHCLGGEKMMHAALKAAHAMQPSPLVLGVTVLTSLSYDDLAKMGLVESLYSKSPQEEETNERFKRMRMENLVQRLALLASECGLDGVICSPQEVKKIRSFCRPDFVFVTPGIRAKDAPPDDQKRTMTAGEAIAAGADCLVIGRPIVKAADPVVAAKQFAIEIEEALALAT